MNGLAAEKPRVLVVLPTLGERLETLERAVLSAVSQEGVNVRVVVVAPRGAERAGKLALQVGAEVVPDPGRGMSAAINAGLAARLDEEFYIWLGDDDVYRPGGLAVLAELLSVNKEAVVAYGACDYVAGDGSVLWVSKAGAWAQWLIGFGPNLIPHPAAMVRLDALESVGRYDETLSLVMDLDVLLKLQNQGPFVSSGTVVSAFGWHPGSLTVADRRASTREARMVKRRHLPPALRWASPLWEYPVAWASEIAAGRLNRRGKNAETH